VTEVELDDAKERVDVEAVHAYLTRSYWAEGRTREEVELHLREATRAIGAYDRGRQVGYARVVVDDDDAGLYDVYVLESHRGRGLGVRLVEAAVEHGPHRALAWHLRTRDAHTLYERFGFTRLDELRMVRPSISDS
jgi:GNAT superfamily N-acetyltransferase